MTQRTAIREARLERLENAQACHARQRVIHRVLKIKAQHIADRELAASIQADIDELNEYIRKAQAFIAQAIQELEAAKLI